MRWVAKLVVVEVRLDDLQSKLGLAGGRGNSVMFGAQGHHVRTLRLTWQCGSDENGVRFLCHAHRQVPYEPNYGWPDLPLVDENGNDISDGLWEFLPCPIHARLFE